VARSGLYFRGIGIMLREGLPSDPTGPGLNRAFAAAALPVNFLCWGRLDQVSGEKRSSPPTTRTLQTSQPPVPAEPWVDLQKLLALAAHRNWGKDWTRTSGVLTYEQGVGSFRNINRLSASDKAEGGTLEKVYNWSSRG
jgi:L-fuconolactonase